MPQVGSKGGCQGSCFLPWSERRPAAARLQARPFVWWPLLSLIPCVLECLLPASSSFAQT